MDETTETDQTLFEGVPWRRIIANIAWMTLLFIVTVVALPAVLEAVEYRPIPSMAELILIYFAAIFGTLLTEAGRNRVPRLLNTHLGRWRRGSD